MSESHTAWAIRQVKKEAWLEGFWAGYKERQDNPDAKRYGPSIRNPYEDGE